MISVCMASYNGIHYIKQQLDSILVQLSAEDELIVSDDGSTDGTIEFLESYQLLYPCIKVIKGPRRGVIENFENAISQAKGEIIFLSDQDDIWETNKISRVLGAFSENGNCVLVLHDADIVDSELNSLGENLYGFRGSKPGLMRCLYKNPYVGCCMAFRRSLNKETMPFPKGIEMHDWWIGLNAECGSRTVQIPDKLIKYRRHEDNVSNMHRHPIKKMIHNRIVFVRELIKRRKQVS